MKQARDGIPSRPVRLTLEMIKFEHSGLRAALRRNGALLASGSGYARRSWPGRSSGSSWRWWGAVGGDGLQRLLDADIDARNPRTRSRHLPAGCFGGFHLAFVA